MWIPTGYQRESVACQGDISPPVFQVRACQPSTVCSQERIVNYVHD